MIDTETLLPCRSVISTVHDHGTFRPARGDTVLVFLAPVLDHRVLCFGREAKIFQRQNLVCTHTDDHAPDEAHDGNDRIAGRIC